MMHRCLSATRPAYTMKPAKQGPGNCLSGRSVIRQPDITITRATLISVVSVSFAVFFGVKSKKRADDEDVAKKAEIIARLDVKMDSLSKNFTDFANDIKLQMQDMRNNFQEVQKKQIEQETTLKHLLSRIEKLEGV